MFMVPMHAQKRGEPFHGPRAWLHARMVSMRTSPSPYPPPQGEAFGFLGAGTILRHANVIRGVTTAASLWFVTVLGLTFGSGEFGLGFIGVGLALLTLYVLPRFEKHIQSDWYATLSVTAGLESLSEAELQNRIEALGSKVKAMRLNYDLEKKQKAFICELKLKKRNVFKLSSSVVSELTKCPGVLQVSWF